MNILRLLWTFCLIYLIELNDVLLWKGNEISLFACVAMQLLVKKDPAPLSKLIIGIETKAIE
jgi:hypothetical protein